MNIRFGSIVVDGKGKLGGHYVGHSGAGAFLASKPLPGSNQAFNGNLQKGVFSRAVHEWRGLSDEEIQNWQTYASQLRWLNSFGMPYVPSAFNAFVKVFSLRFRFFGDEGHEVPPLSSPLFLSDVFDFTETSRGLFVMLDGSPGEQVHAVVYASQPTPAKIAFSRAKYRFVGFAPFISSPVFVDISSFEVAWSYPVNLFWSWFKVYLFHANGSQSNIVHVQLQFRAN